MHRSILKELTTLTREHRQKGLPPPIDLMHAALLHRVIELSRSMPTENPRSLVPAAAAHMPRALEALEGKWTCEALVDAIRIPGRGAMSTGVRTGFAKLLRSHSPERTQYVRLAAAAAA